MKLPEKKENIYPKNEENLKALLSFYFDCDLGNYTEHLNNEFTLNQLEKIAQITHVHVDFLRDKIGTLGGNASNFLQYGIDAMAKNELEWRGSKNRKQITKDLKEVIRFASLF